MPQTIYDVIDNIVSHNKHQGSDIELARILCRGGLHHPREIVHALQSLGCTEADIKEGFKLARTSYRDEYFNQVWQTTNQIATGWSDFFHLQIYEE